jgi:D-glycero-alpha-D-manno-heptose-7-phosphate kinase
MYLSAHPYFDGTSLHLKYSQSELVASVAELRHPIARRVLERLGKTGGLEITSTADVPAGTGLGSSSAFTVGLLNLIYACSGRHVSPAQLAREAIEIEIGDLGAPIGKQDHYASAFGGLNFIRFFSNETVDVAPLVVSPAVRTSLQDCLLMFYTGEQRVASQVLAEQNEAISSKEEKFAAVQRMVQMAYAGKELLEAEDIPGFGRLLHDAWEIKRSLTNRISNASIDRMYDLAREHGAWGGKLLGAGGGGFLLVAAPIEAQAAIRKALGYVKAMPLRLERGGSKIVYMSDDA